MTAVGAADGGRAESGPAAAMAGAEGAERRARAGATASAEAMPQFGPGTALLVIDMQVDFGQPGGGLYVAGGEETVPVVNAHVTAALAAGSPVFYTQDWHPPSTPHFTKDGGRWPVHCVAGSPGAEFLPGLRVAGPVVRKGVGGEDGYSAFTVRDPAGGDEAPTGLGATLAARDARTVVVVGLAGDYCVKESALDARRLGLAVVVPLAATRFVNAAAGDATRAVAEMSAAGVVVTGRLPGAAGASGDSPTS